MPAHLLKIGLIGAGKIGRMHAEHLTTRIPSAEIVMIADVFEENARQCAQRYAIPLATQDYRAILDRPDIEAVVICSSTDTHADIIEDAAEAGKHIFCEKPIALDLPSIDRALAAVARTDIKLQLGFNRRFDASYRRVRQAVEQEETGRLQQLHIISRDPAPPPIEYLSGSGGVDPATILLRFTNGVIGTIENIRRAAAGYDQRVEVLGSVGAVRTENKYSNTAIISDSSGIRRDLPPYFYIERYSESYVAEMEAFVDAVLHDKPTSVSGHDGRMAAVLGLATKKSVAEHRPVYLNEIGSEAY